MNLEIKHKDEWEQLIDLCENSDLSVEHTIFLLALREIEDGKKGTEFGVKTVQGTDLERQAQFAISSIKQNEKRWQKWCKEKGKIDFVDFFFWYGGPYGTGWSYNLSVKDMKYFINKIQEEFDGPKELN